MNENNNSFRKITPASVDANSTNKITHSDNSLNRFNLKRLSITLGVFFLSIGVIIVIFFLPSWVENKSPNIINAEINPSGNNENTANVVNTNKLIEISPWEKAQDGQARKETQFVLQKILEVQKQLEDKNVKDWADTEYHQALAEAKQGDNLYNQQQYVHAKDQYDIAVKKLSVLVDRIGILYKTNIQKGNAALENGDQATALEAFTTALLFQEQTGEAAKGLQRAEILDQVLKEINAGDEAVNNGHYNEARTFYQAALNLDPDTKLASSKLAENNRRLNDIQFRHHMTTGFKALEQQEYQKANSEFNNALKLKPGSNEAIVALQQTNTQSTNEEISLALSAAANAEIKEDWQTAINHYQTALKKDSNLSAAIAGLDDAKAKLATYNKIIDILAQPERLNDKAVYNEVERFYQSLTQLSSTGSILTKQIKQLGTQLSISATPINIRLLSDNLTEVTVYKVGKLGVFESKEISLRPGKYTAIGIRSGYRDVRIDFLVSTEKNNTVNIRTQEKIN